MSYLTVGREVVRGSICRDRWHADVTIMCSDRIPIHRLSYLFLAVQWRNEGEKGKVDLIFEKVTESGGGEIRIDALDGPTEKRFTGSVRQLVPIYGHSTTTGGKPYVVLKVKVEKDEFASIPLSVGQPATRVAIRAENGTDLPPMRLGERARLKAVASLEAPGTVRWISVSPTLLTIAGDGSGDLVEVAGAPHPDAFLPRVEDGALITRTRALSPLRIYRVADLYLADEAHRRLETSANGKQYALRAGTRITVVAETKGVLWRAGFGEIRFTVNGASGFRKDLAATRRTRERLESAVWEYPQTGVEPKTYQISVSVTHRTLGRQTLKTEEVRVYALL
jgi:hypothetical protein